MFLIFFSHIGKNNKEILRAHENLLSFCLKLKNNKMLILVWWEGPMKAKGPGPMKAYDVEV